MAADDHDPLKDAERFAEILRTPVFIVDPDGNLLFYNEAAGKVLGRRFSETGPMAASAWTRIFVPTDESGNPLLPESLPLMIALTELRPAYGTMWIRGLDNLQRHLGVAAVPITQRGGEIGGSMAVFWELREGRRP